jgi:diphthine synthase
MLWFVYWIIVVCIVLVCAGLQLYNFGEIISIVFWTDDWQPDSYVDKLEENAKRGLHTLCLLGACVCVCACVFILEIKCLFVTDIKVKEQTVENLMRNRAIYEPPRYMHACDAAKQLLTIAEKRRANGKSVCKDLFICLFIIYL